MMVIMVIDDDHNDDGHNDDHNDDDDLVKYIEYLHCLSAGPNLLLANRGGKVFEQLKTVFLRRDTRETNAKQADRAVDGRRRWRRWSWHVSTRGGKETVRVVLCCAQSEIAVLLKDVLYVLLVCLGVPEEDCVRLVAQRPQQ